MKKHKLAFLGAVALVAGVTASAQPRAALRVDSAGNPLSALVSENDSSVVVVYDPGACFKCDSLMPRLLDWAYAHPGRFAVVLTRRASQAEQEQMTLLKIEPKGIVARDRRALVGGRRYRAEVILFVNGIEVHSEPYDAGLSQGRRDLYAYLLEWAVDGDALREQ